MDHLPLLENPRSDRIKGVAALRSRSGRRRQNRILVEGPQAVRELLRFRPHTIVDVYLEEQIDERDPELLDLALDTSRWVHPVTDQVANAISPDCQGVAAVASKEALATDSASLWRSVLKAAPKAEPAPFIVFLPETQDPGNLGTIIRTADAMGARGVVLGLGTADPANPKVIRASAGSVFHLPIARASLAELRQELHGWTLLGTRGYEADTSVDDLLLSALVPTKNGETPVLKEPHVWVFGNEARGLSADDVDACDLLVKIPLAGHAESLNAAAAAAMCMFASHTAARSFVLGENTGE